MKAPVGSSLVTAVLCASALFTVAAASVPGFGLRGSASAGDACGRPLVARTVLEGEALEPIVAPNRRLRAAVWIYFRHRAIDLPQVVADGGETAVVTLNRDAMRDLALLNEETVRMALAQPE